MADPKKNEKNEKNVAQTKSVVVVPTRTMEKKGRGFKLLTQEIAMELVQKVRSGEPISKVWQGVRIANVDSEIIPYNRLRLWIVNRTVPEGGKVSLRQLLETAREKYHKQKREKILREAEKVLLEDLTMDTTVEVQRKGVEKVETQTKDGKVKVKLVPTVDTVRVISPKLRQIRSQTAIEMAKRLDKENYGDRPVEINNINTQVQGNNSTISLLQLRAYAEKRANKGDKEEKEVVDIVQNYNENDITGILEIN